MSGTANPNPTLWTEWRSLVNMTAKELRTFQSAHPEAGTEVGHTSARELGFMLESGGRGFRQAQQNWSYWQWNWAGRQVAFIKRMSGSRGPLFDTKGRETRKYLALKLWGHDPLKKA